MQLQIQAMETAGVIEPAAFPWKVRVFLRVFPVFSVRADGAVPARSNLTCPVACPVPHRPACAHP